MQTNVYTPQQVLHLPQHLVVPVYQRPYVWNEEDQWRPLWSDVRRMAELRLSGASPSAQHFLGAIVLQQLFVPQATMTQTAIVDGQQRLTTLQLLMDATGAVLVQLGLQASAERLGFLTINSQQFARAESEILKLQHRNRDGEAYRAVMLSEPPLDYSTLDQSSRLVLAHSFFAECASDWIGEGADAAVRGAHLVSVLEAGLQLVVITLQAEEDSQEIFETLNARGTPLTATDLIKNFVFQRLAQEGYDVDRAYQQRWRVFESKFWEQEVSAGRLLMPRSALFITQWLGSKVGEEISPRSAFARFRSYVEHEARTSIGELLDGLIEHANRYEGWVKRSQEKDGDLTPIELFVYRMRAAGVDTATPALLALTDPALGNTDVEIERALQAIESWLVRRMLVRLQSANHGFVIAELIRLLRVQGATAADEIVLRHLSSLSVATTYWPTDEEVREALVESRAYRNYPRGRLRMFLEACEDALRGYLGSSPSRTGSRVTRGVKHIEHVLPQRWRVSWAVDDQVAELEREQHLHRFGNLTLLTAALNSSVSNGPWLGETGKRRALNSHDVLLLNVRLQSAGENGWDERKIDERTEALIQLLLATWTVPVGHVGLIEKAAPGSADDVGVDQLIIAGVLTPGMALSNPRNDTKGELLPNGWIRVDGRDFPSLTAAARSIASGSVSGWWFWRTPDGRKLRELREAHAAAKVARQL